MEKERRLIMWDKEKFFLMPPVALWRLSIDYSKGKIADYKPSQNVPSIHLIGNETTSFLLN